MTLTGLICRQNQSEDEGDVSFGEVTFDESQASGGVVECGG
jgi:hypothetical protein